MSATQMTRPILRSILAACLALLAGVVGSTGVAQQAGTPCPARAPYTLAKILEAVGQKAPPDAVASDITVCHVAFALDANALDQLSMAGAPPAVMEALNRDTLLRLTRDQAHAEVAGMMQREQAIETEVNTERDEALRKLDAEYQAQRAKAAYVPPKDPFTSTAEYGVQMQRAQIAAAAVDRKHDAAVAQANADYQAKTELKNRPFRDRIEFLEKSQYVVAVAALFASYDADSERLTATIGGQEYWFDNVPGNSARQLNENWKSVEVVQPYADDTLETRILRLAEANIRIAGSLRAAVEAAAQKARAAEILRRLEEAKAAVDRHDYEGARTSYQSVLEIDPDNQTAKNALTAIRSEQERESALVETQRAAGEWVDPRTHLMWTLKDNGAPTNLKGAFEYCQALRTGGFSDWRIASIEELGGLYDPKVTRNTVPSTKPIFLTYDGKVIRIPAGTYVPYHIAGGITLTMEQIWSGSQYPQDPGRVGLGWNYTRGESYTEYASEKVVYRVLCVRSYQPTSDLDDAPASVAARSSTMTEPQEQAIPRPNPAENVNQPDMKTSPENPGQEFLGTWVGMMQSSTGQRFPVVIRLNAFAAGNWCGLIHHPPPLDADGKLLCVKVQGNRMTVSQTITRGRERCLDGVSVLTLIDKDTLERVWIDPATGVGRDRGLLKRRSE